MSHPNVPKSSLFFSPLSSTFACVTLLFPVTVSLKPAGNAPLLRQRKFLVERSRTVGWMIQWLKKTLKCEPEESVVREITVHHQ